MKNIFLALAAFITVAACNNKSDDKRDIKLLNDTSAYGNDMYSDTSATQSLVAPVPAVVAPRSVTATQHTKTSSTTAPVSSPKSSAGSGTTQTSSTTKKKGWSSATKGAVIGAGTGAIGGAIISKKKGKGAVIGGVAGAAGGYIIGKEIDKKKDR